MNKVILIGNCVYIPICISFETKHTNQLYLSASISGEILDMIPMTLEEIVKYHGFIDITQCYVKNFLSIGEVYNSTK